MIRALLRRLHAPILCAIVALGMGNGQTWAGEGKNEHNNNAYWAFVAQEFLHNKSSQTESTMVDANGSATSPDTPEKTWTAWSISNVGWSMAQTILTSSFSYCITRVYPVIQHYFFKTHLSNAASLAQSLTLAQSPEEAAIIQTRLATALVKQDAIKDPEGIETNQRILLLIEYSRFKDPEFLPFARKIYEQKLKQETSSEPQDFAAFKKRYNQQHAESLKQVAAQEKASQQPSNLKTAKA